MKAQAATALAGLVLLVLAGCAAPYGAVRQAPIVPPSWAELDRTAYNNQQVALFVSRDQGWQAWLNAIRASEAADNALVDASRYNTPVTDIIQGITAAQDAYRVATSFNLTPFTVTSGCRDIASETNGSVRLNNGLIVHYGYLLNETSHFENGSSCLISVGFIDEIASSRGLPVVTADRSAPIDWSESFSHDLVWRQPYWKLSTGTTLSVPDMVVLIEK